jgi:ABC-type Fe3+-hydroxamate transport system substrate-binding protein
MQFAMVKRPRIVSLAPSVTSILWAIGAQGDVVGVSKWCAAVAPVGRLPRVGDCWAVDPAPIGRLRPTLLVGSVPFKPETMARLLELGAPLVAINPRTLADICGDIELLGRITGRVVAAGRVAQKMSSDLKEITKRAKRNAGKPRVYCEAWPNPRISSPPWVAELVELAGGTPAVPAGQRVSDEEVAAARPDVIVLAWTATGGKSEPRRALGNLAWRNVPAVREGRVFAFQDELLNTPAPILVEGARELARVIRMVRQEP